MYARNVRGVAVELSLMIRPWSCNKKVIVKQQLVVLYKYSRQRQSLWLPPALVVYFLLQAQEVRCAIAIDTTRRVPAAHLAAQAAQQLADIYK